MSADKNQQKIDNLLRVARRSTDAESRWQIARELQAMGAWQEAREVERLAEQAERAQAVSA